MSNNKLGGARTPTQLVEALVKSMSCWGKYENYYLTELAPMLAANPESGSAQEQLILSELRPQLTENEWRALPQLMAEYRNGNLREFESEKLKREIQEKERLETERKQREELAKAERERIHKELLMKEAAARKQELLAKIDKELQRDFLGAESFFKSQTQGIVSYDEFKIKKIGFVREWFVNRSKSLGISGTLILDDEQLEAIACVNGHVQVVARAGSGKTATLVNRALFLMEHCRVTPSSLMILAFNRKAATEIRRRLLSLIHQDAERQVKFEFDKRRSVAIKKGRRFNYGDLEAESVDQVATQLQVALPHVMTFHALAYALVHPEESLLYNDSAGESQALNKVLQNVIDDHMQIPEYKSKIRELMIENFKEDWDRIIAGGYNLSKNELIQFKRSLPRESLRGEYVKSYGEKLIANFLFEYDIPYKYERNYWWRNINYRPDFTIFKTKKSGIIIEYFGLKGDPDYDEMSEEKRNFWANNSDWELIEFSPSDIKQGETAFGEFLKTSLEQRGIPCNQLSEEEIWNRVRDRAIDRFTKAMVSFVGRCRKLSMAPDELDDTIDAHEALSRSEAMFLPLAHDFYSAYLERLSATGQEDFDGLMQRAAKMVLNGVTRFQRKSGNGDLAELKFIFIDEFQDFTDLFYRLLSSIKKVSPDAQLFCVGDDWQAINGFAGSDLRFFEHFDEFIGKSHHLSISTNYRSARSIVDLGNALMTNFGKSAVADKKDSGKVIIADTTAFKPSPVEKERHSGDIITPMVSRIVNESLATNSSVVLLSRRNSLPWFMNFTDQVQREGKGLDKFLDLVRSLSPKDKSENITISTAHRYKGLEKSTVIVLDAVAGSYPLIHPDWVFLRVLGDSLEKVTQEERRLFYVALTRAIEKLVIITDSKNQSPFLGELQKTMPLEKIKWDDYPVVCLKSRRLVVKVGNSEHCGGKPTYAIKDQLKACGYQWRGSGWPGWVKTFSIDEIQVASIQKEVWAEEADGVEVRICDESERVFGRFNIVDGNWVTVLDDLHLILATSGN